MVSELKVFQSDGTNPYRNLAIEEELLNSVTEGTCILYLWQNKNTVVIGRNQNAWVECRTERLNNESGYLARRLSGGGAVYHDLGNLNFTFLISQEDYDLEKQLRVIQSAILKFGIPVEFSGRNDLLADGRKFSGNAFYHSNGKSYHHGTILINTDSERMSRYLSPSAAKLQAKGVTSVRSRIINLIELNPMITHAEVREKLIESFSEVYGLPAQKMVLSDAQLRKIQERTSFFGSWDWLYGAPLPFSFSCEDHFQWGSFQLFLQINKGLIINARVYTDAMQWQIAQELEMQLKDQNFTITDMQNAIRKSSHIPETIVNDICNLLIRQNI